MIARHKDTGEIIELAEEGIISHDGRHFCWHQVELIPEPIDECKSSLLSSLDEAANKFGLKETHERLKEGEITRKNEGMFRWQIEKAFKAGAEWVIEQGVDLTHLIMWYIQSVDAHEPIWTEEHLKELVKDYILIPKD